MDRYVVDGMNVIGSRPDGWWRDLDTAVIRLARCLAAWRAAEGHDAMVVFDGRPPPGLYDAGLDDAGLDDAGLDDVDLGGLEVAFAGKGRSADDEIVRRVEADPDPGSLRVVTSDRPLAERVRAAGAGEVVGAGGFRRLLDRYC